MPLIDDPANVFQTCNYLNNANEYGWKARNNKSTIELNGIPTFFLLHF
jgi:hypothetical protein